MAAQRPAGAATTRRLKPGRSALIVSAVAAMVAVVAFLVLVPPAGRDLVVAPELERPNIVLVLTDDQSFESLARMPYVSGRQDWITFDNAFVNVPLCCPSRASILSGQYSHHSGVETNDAGAGFRDADTFATWLRGTGYRTGLIGKYLNGYPWGRAGYVPPGWDDWRAFQRAGYFDYSLIENARSVRRGSAPADYSTDVLARKAAAFIAAGTDPFLLVVAPFAPHAPRTPAPRHRSAFGDEEIPAPASLNEGDVSDKPAWVRALDPQRAESMENQRRKQYRSLLAVDDLVRGLFDALRDKGVLDSTVFVFTTDNGYSFGEHRHVRKTCPYEECVHVPLLVRYPGQRGISLRALAQHVDIAATFADLAGVTPTVPQDGRSLVPLLRGERTSWRDAVLLRWAGYPGGPTAATVGPDIPAFWGLRTARYKYVELETGERELYDLRADPDELDNLASHPSSSGTMARLRELLTELRGD